MPKNGCFMLKCYLLEFHLLKDEAQHEHGNVYSAQNSSCRSNAQFT